MFTGDAVSVWGCEHVRPGDAGGGGGGTTVYTDSLPLGRRFDGARRGTFGVTYLLRRYDHIFKSGR